MNKFRYTELPQGLEASILKVVSEKRRKTTRIHFTLLATTSLLSLVGLIKASLLLWQGFIQTGFYQYASLLLSDGGLLSNYWKEFAYSLAESLPILSLISLLAVLTIFIWSTSKALKDARLVFLQT